jgi:hypothetical protein
MKPGSFASPETDTPAGTPLGVQFLSFLCGLVVAYLGCKSAWQDYRHMDKLSHLERFVATPAHFLQVRVRQDSASSGDYYPDVLYEYFVDGKSIWGWRLSYEEEPKSRDYWEKRLAGFSTGGAIQAFYNPADPKDSILEKRHESLYRTALKLGLGMIFVLAGALLAILPAAGWLKKGLSFKK